MRVLSLCVSICMLQVLACNQPNNVDQPAVKSNELDSDHVIHVTFGIDNDNAVIFKSKDTRVRALIDKLFTTQTPMTGSIPSMRMGPTLTVCRKHDNKPVRTIIVFEDWKIYNENDKYYHADSTEMRDYIAAFLEAQLNILKPKK